MSHRDSESWQNFRLSIRLHFPPETLESIYRTIAEIDAVKASWKLSDRLLPQTLERLTRCVIVTSTGASNRIEGNKLNDFEVESLYKKLRSKKFLSRDEQEVAGYLEVLEEIFQNYSEIPVTESTILQIHRDMLQYSEKDQRHKGCYKFTTNRVEAKDPQGNVIGVLFEPTPPHLVEKEMRELIEWYSWACKNNFKHPLILIANFIFEFLAIHPFLDGNGRTSRLLTNLMLLHHSYKFVTVISQEKCIEANVADYYSALNQTQKTWKTEKEDITAWLLFFLRIIQLQARQAFKILEEEQFEFLLSEKQLQLWKWALSIPNREFSRKDAIRALGFPARTVESIIQKLLSYRKLERLGQGRATRYRVITNFSGF